MKKALRYFMRLTYVSVRKKGGEYKFNKYNPLGYVFVIIGCIIVGFVAAWDTFLDIVLDR